MDTAICKTLSKKAESNKQNNNGYCCNVVVAKMKIHRQDCHQKRKENETCNSGKTEFFRKLQNITWEQLFT